MATSVHVLKAEMPTLETLVDDYLNACTARGLSPATTTARIGRPCGTSSSRGAPSRGTAIRAS